MKSVEQDISIWKVEEDVVVGRADLHHPTPPLDLRVVVVVALEAGRWNWIAVHRQRPVPGHAQYPVGGGHVVRFDV